MLFTDASERDAVDDEESTTDDAPGEVQPIQRMSASDERPTSSKGFTKFQFSNAHPNSDNVFALLRYLAVDQLSNSKDKGVSTIESMLDSLPLLVHGSLNAFQLELFSVTLSHFCHIKALSDSLHSSAKLVSNIGRYVALMQERLMTSSSNTDELSILYLLVKLIRQAVDENGNAYTFAEAAFGASTIRGTIEAVYKSMNKIVLLLLSQTNAPNPDSITQTVQLLTEDHSVFICDGNRDTEFIACLAYRAMTLLESEPPFHDLGIKLWRSLMKLKMRELVSFCATPIIIAPNAATLPNEEFRRKVADLRFQMEDAVTKAWGNFVNAKSKAMGSSQSNYLGRAIPSFRKLSASANKRDKKIKQEAIIAYQFKSSQQERLHSEHSLRAKVLRRIHHKLLDARRVLSSEWTKIEAELHRERGLWGPALPNPLDKWQLDVIEGPLRMRKRLQSHPSFYIKFPYYPEGLTEVVGNDQQLVIKVIVDNCALLILYIMVSFLETISANEL